MDSKSIFEAAKLQIGNLNERNWSSWKYKISIILRGISGVINILEGKTCKPESPTREASSEDVENYNKKLRNYQKLDSTALFIMTSNMTDETLQKVIRFTTAKDVWDELHRLFDGISEDRAYDLCMKFFSYKKHSEDDIGTHLS